MARSAYIPTSQEIDKLYEDGDIDALRSINETLAKRANQRLSELEKRDMQTAAYNRAMDYIQEYSEIGNGKNFSRRKSLDIDDLYLNINQECNFLRSQTSTVSGEKKRRDKIYDSLSEIEKEDGTKLFDDVPEEDQEEHKKKFLEFLDTDVWSDIKKSLYSDTNLTMEEASEAIAQGADITELVDRFNKYRKGETDTDIFEIWEDWKNPFKNNS